VGVAARLAVEMTKKEMIFVRRKALSLMFCEAMAGKTMPGEPNEMAAATSEMATARVALLPSPEA
jgi:hypothetical protein